MVGGEDEENPTNAICRRQAWHCINNFLYSSILSLSSLRNSRVIKGAHFVGGLKRITAGPSTVAARDSGESVASLGHYNFLCLSLFLPSHAP